MRQRLRERLPLLLVWLLIIAYTGWFSALSIDRHRAFLTHASDLGQIDQAIWNTLQGHLLEHTRTNGLQDTRLSAHVEPLFVPLSLVFVLYDNVEALLIVQSAAIALGALAVYWIARRKLAAPLAGTQQFADYLAVAFAAVYLLFPALEAANLAEFHAVALAPAPLLFAYNYASEKAWGRFAVFALLALAVQEDIALLVLFMAAWFAVQPLSWPRREWMAAAGRLIRGPRSIIRNRLPALIAGLAATWFVLAVFVIIPHFNATGRSPFTCRYIVSEDCPELATGLFLVERGSYVVQLLASVGWVAVLDPVSLLLGLPLLVANLISNYPAQYSGTFHYSAPVAPYFVLAGIGGTARLAQWFASRRIPLPGHLAPLFAPILLLALTYHLFAGYSPLGGALDWPKVSAHNQRFAELADKIPRDAKVSTTAALNPHLSHRSVLYRYATIKDADYVLLDVAESNSVNPLDFRLAYNALVDSKTFGVSDAVDGYVLLQRGAPSRLLPDAFYSLFRAAQPMIQVPAQVEFGGRVRLLGYDVVTDAYGRGSIRLYWQRLAAMDKNYNLYTFYPDAEGRPRTELSLQPTLLFWYPTSMWKANETIVGQTVPFDLGPRARVGLAVLDGDDWENVALRLPARPAEPGRLAVFDNSTWVELGTIVKSGNRYRPAPPLK